MQECSSTRQSASHLSLPLVPPDGIATVQITSEDPVFPIEGALVPEGSGWRAATVEDQTIRIVFKEPVHLREIEMLFMERTTERRQEYLLRWSPGPEGWREIVRQQFHFSPKGAVCELERHQVDLFGVRAVELLIQPGSPDCVASLEHILFRQQLPL